MACPDDNALAEYCDGLADEKLRVRIEAHFGDCEACRSLVSDFMRGVPGPAEPAEPAPKSADPEDPATPSDRRSAGDRVGRFEIHSTIGSGSMGIVYVAWDPELDRKVALKVLRRASPGTGPNRDEGRLLREAKALARLSHPNVVAVHEVGDSPTGVYLAMEFIEGRTLARWLEDDRSASEVVAMLAQAGQGLAAAHAAGIVHRDFKPSNIMVGDDNRVRVVDFGLAGDHGGTVDTRPAGSRATGLAGTPAYMSPEQRRGDRAGAAADQYAFCVTLFEAIHGHRPRAPPEFDRALPDPVRRVLERGLQPDPSDRFESMDALLRSLCPPPRRRRGLWIAAGMALGGLGAVGFLGRGHDDPCVPVQQRARDVWVRARPQAETAFEATGLPYSASTWQRIHGRLADYTEILATAHRDACRAAQDRTQTADTAERRLACVERAQLLFSAQLDVFAVADTTTVEHAASAVDSLPDPARCNDAGLSLVEVDAPDPAIAYRVSAVRGELARARAWLVAGRYEDAASTLASLDSASLGYAPVRAETHLHRGWLASAQGEREEAESAFGSALEWAERSRHDEVRADALVSLTEVIGVMQARHDEGRRLASLGAAVLERIDAAPQLQATLADHRGRIEFDAGDFEEAAVAYEHALALLGDHTQTLEGALAHYHLATAAARMGRHEQSIDGFTRALEIATDVLGPTHPRRATFLQGLGGNLAEAGRISDALPHLTQAVSLNEAVFGPDHATVGVALGNVGFALYSARNYEEAHPVLERSLRIMASTHPEDHPTRAWVCDNLGKVEIELHDLEAAEGHVEAAMKARVATLGEDHPSVADSLTALALIARHRGQTDRARDLYRRTITVLESRYEADHPDLVRVRGLLSALPTESPG